MQAERRAEDRKAHPGRLKHFHVRAQYRAESVAPYSGRATRRSRASFI